MPRQEQLTAADGGRFLLTYLAGPQPLPQAPVVLVHGMFTDRRFWLSDKGVGLAVFLAEAGHPVYIVQRRGLSDSPACTARCGLDEHLYQDLPVVSARVAEEHGIPAVWIGHSFGGVSVARAVADVLDPDRVAALVLLASQFERGKHLLDWPGNLAVRTLVRLRGHLPARVAGLGPVDETAAAVHDACRWVTDGRRTPTLRLALARITVPVLALSGTADRVDPTDGCRSLLDHTSSRAPRFIRAGRTDGFSQDYDHPGIVISRAAREEIWPLIGDWVRTAGRAVPTAACRTSGA